MQAQRLTLTLTTVTLLAFTLVGLVKASPTQDLVETTPTIEIIQQR